MNLLQPTAATAVHTGIDVLGRHAANANAGAAANEEEAHYKENVSRFVQSPRGIGLY